MATICFAMWLQEPDLARTNNLIMIFMGIMAVAMMVMAVVLIVVAVNALKVARNLAATADDFKGKVFPLVELVTDISRSSRDLLHDAAPKVKVITDNLVKTSDSLVAASNTARKAAQEFDATITDVNRRTQRQVARVDGMVTAALTTTAEVVETINNGIRGPVQKIAVMATQAKLMVEGLLAKIKSKAAGTPFGNR